MVSTLEQMQVPNGTGPGVRRSKRPLLASRTRCNVLWKPPKFGNKVNVMFDEIPISTIKLSEGRFQNLIDILNVWTISDKPQMVFILTIKSRKYSGVFDMQGQEQTRQAREKFWSKKNI